MYPDNTLTPKEAIRLCALGTLAQGPLRYSALANAVRHFISRILGPSVELMGTSIELLKYEGLIEAVNGTGAGDDAELAISESGRRQLEMLITANLRSGTSELNKVVMTLKFRFLHLLDTEGQRTQADLLIDVCANELARLDDLRQHHAGGPGFLVPWLDHDVDLLESRIAWLKAFSENLCKTSHSA
jgi:DNA-binding PadR family transcriptional regulator